MSSSFRQSSVRNSRKRKGSVQSASKVQACHANNGSDLSDATVAEHAIDVKVATEFPMPLPHPGEKGQVNPTEKSHCESELANYVKAPHKSIWEIDTSEVVERYEVNRSGKCAHHENCKAPPHDDSNLQKFVAEHKELVRKTLAQSTDAILHHIQALASEGVDNLLLQSTVLHDNVQSDAMFRMDCKNSCGPWVPTASDATQVGSIGSQVSSCGRQPSSLGMQHQASSVACTHQASSVRFGSEDTYIVDAGGGSTQITKVMSKKIDGPQHRASRHLLPPAPSASRLFIAQTTTCTNADFTSGTPTQFRQKLVLSDLPEDYQDYLETQFKRLAEEEDCISLDKVIGWIQPVISEQIDRDSLMDVLRQVRANSAAHGRLSKDSCRSKVSEFGEEWMTFEDFAYLMTRGHFDTEPSSGARKNTKGDELLHRMQSALIAFDRYEDTLALRAEQQRANYQRLFVMLDFLPAPVILLNALVIGLRSDIDSDGLQWKIFDLLFLAFYTVEAGLKVGVFGCSVFWCGPGWPWNWFDVFCILVSVGDVSVTYIIPLFSDGSGTQFENVGLMKMLRLAKLSRLVKALRYPIFDELRSMVFGVVAGMRVLIWALVLLFVCVFFLGAFANSLIADTPEFDTVPASMFTVFRCFTDGCDAYDGTPLTEHLRKKYGAVFILAYALSFMFVTVGVFNLIMATFIENVLHSTALNKQEELGRQTENIRSGLERIAVRLIIQMNKSKRHRVISDYLMKEIEMRWDKDVDAAFRILPKNLVISKTFFLQWLQDKEFLWLIERAGIDLSCTTNLVDLFDVLDADMSGELTLAELIDGLMKLRGPITKRDMIGVRMQVRFISQMLNEQIGMQSVDSVKTVLR